MPVRAPSIRQQRAIREKITKSCYIFVGRCTHFLLLRVTHKRPLLKVFCEKAKSKKHEIEQKLKESAVQPSKRTKVTSLCSKLTEGECVDLAEDRSSCHQDDPF
ncbi:hypothetical protein UPYG_G00286980 [Umbra pygmaea]|uniref:Uncharacterized protein n=1 Tax=Umbra pygmaea TaxID=75934 RepID=A0ABD0W544_UMBPY